MRSSENESPNKQATGNYIQKEADIYEDEINLIGYFRVLWKRKWLVLVTSVLPPLVVGLVVFLGPRRYTLTYTYDVKDQFKGQTTVDVSNWNLDEKNYNVLLNRVFIGF